MQLSIATTSVPGDLLTKLETIARTGFHSIELHEPDLTGSMVSAKEIGAQARQLGLSITVLQPFHDFEGLKGPERALAFKRLEQKIQIMQQLGAQTLLVGTSTHPESSGNFAQLRDDFQLLSEYMGKAGLRAALIALPFARTIKTEMQALEIVQSIDSPHLGLALNSYFSLADGSRPARLRDIPGQYIYHVQLSDAPRLGFDISNLKSHFGLLPGQGELNLAGFVRVIARSGYQGPWSITRVNDASRDKRETYARDGYRALVSLLDEVALNEPALEAPIENLPARVYPQGIEFIEFTVDEPHRKTLCDLLGSLCFRQERQHVSKSVELWRQGAINLVVNSSQEGFAAQALAENGPSVCDMALRVNDAGQTVERALKLGTPEFSQPVGTGELDIPAIEGVGKSLVHFIDEKSDLHRVWDIEFDAVPKTQATAPAGLRRIDHIAQTMRYQEMQSWLTYYTSTFEMEKAPVVDVADPSGVVLSQALSSPAGELRLNLNGAGQQRTFAGAFLADSFGAGVQHIAFSSDDIFETSKRLAENHFQRLKIPSNYYDNLAVEFPLDADFIERLRQGNILYDCDGENEYFQIYSTPIFRGFFFEIVQRKKNYNGYGARNASIRLAAQMNHLQEQQCNER